jgi:predicted SAM-dependent methyltransferase
MLIFASDTVLRAQNGQMVIHTTAGVLPPFVTESPQLIGWLAQFMRAKDVDRALSALDSTNALAAKGVIEYLQKIGALVEAQSDAAELPTAGAAHARSAQHLSALARQIYDLSADVQGLGEFAESQLRKSGGAGLERRLLSLGASIDGLRRELSALREPHLAAQFDALKLDSDAQQLKLHLGCGPVHLVGFINIDIAPAPLSMNVLWGLPFDDGSVATVYLSHLLEHLFYPTDVMALFGEIHRVLAPGGVIRVVVPDIAKCLAAYARGDQAFFAARRENFSWWPSDASLLENFLTYAGVGPEPRYLFEAHKYGYDFETLAKALAKAGFSEVTQSEFQQSREPALRIEHLSAAASWRAGEEYLSLFVDATRP